MGVVNLGASYRGFEHDSVLIKHPAKAEKPGVFLFGIREITAIVRAMVPNLVSLVVAAGDVAPEPAISPESYIPFTLLTLLGIAIPVVMLTLSWLFHKHNSTNKNKDEPYECGLRSTLGTAEDRVSVKFYLIAMLFLVFDLEVAFLYPLALEYTNQEGWGLFGLLAAFLVMLEVGYLYLYRKGALDWDR